MFKYDSLDKLDPQYFNIIWAYQKDVTIQSKNTGHWWYLHCTEYPMEESLVLYHKHTYQLPYHQHSRERSLRKAIKSIQGHDKWQMNGRKRT